MCHYITSVVPNNTNLEELQRILESYNLGFDEIMNPSISRQISIHYKYFRPTTGTCDCGTELGRLNYYKRESHDSTKTLALKLSKKGWSKSKIDRWIEEKDKNQSKHDRKFEYLKNTNSTETKFWIDFIHNILSSNITNEFGLLLHWYDKSLESNFLLKGISKVKFAEGSDFFFDEVEEDILYIFSK
ncbi:hypothetical protein MAL08_19640 (plasmid) [Leptospira noguchii]|uniref:hypothetical protein n=1 Tax=Leptospira noguchii TaxID=28182 RepID=UPI001FB75612|nr:hypothetical protein [Leptospira noguchii]UOG39961.1 hypothetical protein MAL08_19640 [Leptospira noguchii]